MPLSLATATTFVNLCIGVSSLCAADSWELAEVKRALDCLKDARSLKETIRSLGLTDTTSKLAKAAQKRVADLESSPEFAATAADCLALFEQVLPTCHLNPATLVTERTAVGIVTHWRTQIAATAPKFIAAYYADPTTAEARFFAEVTTPIIDALLRDPAFQPVLEFDRWNQALGMLEEILSLVRELRETKETTVPLDTLMALARKIRPSVRTREDALAELEAATDLAAEAIARGEQGTNVDAFVDEVFHRLAKLTEAGELETAAQTAQEEYERAKAGIAQLRDQTIRQHLLNRDAVAAARLIVEVVKEEAAGDQVAALRAERKIWYERGRAHGVGLDLEVAIALCNQTRPFCLTDDHYGMVLNDLGTALATLGKRETGTQRLDEAVAAYHSALQVRPHDRVPLDWAMTQNNLGNALSTLGQRETGTQRLDEAVAAYRAALEVYTRDRLPLDWAMTQMNLGIALATLCRREAGAQRLEEAVAAFRAALQVWTRDRVPLDWAMAQMNLGNALRIIGQRETGIQRLDEAVAAYRAALEVYTRDRLPLEWATTQTNLGNALKTLGERETGTQRLEQAVAAYRAALEERTRDRVPLEWAMTQMNLGNALQTLGQRETGTQRLDEAVAAYRAALEVRTRDRLPLDWATTQNNLGAALSTLGKRETGTQRLDEAIAAYRAALEVWTRDRVPIQWAITRFNMALLHLALFDKTGDPADLDLAETAVHDAREVFAQGAPLYVTYADQALAVIAARR